MLRTTIVFVLFMASVLSGGGEAAAQPLRIGGTGSALAGMRLLAEAFRAEHPDVEVEVLPSLGSSGGIKAVLAHAIDIAVAARPLKDKEVAAGAKGRRYATTPLVLATSGRTAADGLSTAELAAMFAGDRARWPDGTPVRLVMRPESETDIKLLRRLSPAMDAAVARALTRSDVPTALNDQENADLLERLDGSLGVISLAQLTTEERRLKVLAVDDVAPNVDGRAKVDDTFVKELQVVTVTDSSPLAASFADFVLSPAGRFVLEATGHRPVP